MAETGAPGHRGVGKAERRASPVREVEVTGASCTPDVVRQVLGATPFFADLDAAEIEGIADSFRQHDFQPGEMIHRAGEPAAQLSIVAAGTVKIARPTPDGQDVLIDFLHPGDFFGSLAILGEVTYPDDAAAHTTCCVLRATSAAFQHLLERHPSAAMATLAFVASRLRDAQDTIERLSARPVDQRIASTLLKLADRVGRPDAVGTLIDIPLSRQDLADMTGTTVETASRVISELRRAGTIDSGRRWIAIADRPALAALAAGEPDR